MKCTTLLVSVFSGDSFFLGNERKYFAHIPGLNLTKVLTLFGSNEVWLLRNLLLLKICFHFVTNNLNKVLTIQKILAQLQFLKIALLLCVEWVVVLYQPSFLKDINRLLIHCSNWMKNCLISLKKEGHYIVLILESTN